MSSPSANRGKPSSSNVRSAPSAMKRLEPERTAYSYPSAFAQMEPYNVVPVGVEMDGEGMIASELESLLSGWRPEEHEGRKKPHVMCASSRLSCHHDSHARTDTVPIGQNPTGTTMGLQRKQEIYDVCVKHGALLAPSRAGCCEMTHRRHHLRGRPVLGASDARVR